MINTPLNDESTKSEERSSGDEKLLCAHLCMLYGLLLKVYKKAFSTCEMPYAIQIMTSKGQIFPFSVLFPRSHVQLGSKDLVV